VNKYQQQVPAPPQVAPSYADRQFLHQSEAAVWVPLKQSAVTGVIVFIACFGIAFKVNAIDLFTWPLVLGVLAFGGSWAMYQYRWIILTKLEQALGMDLNNDHYIGTTPAPMPTVIRIEKITNGSYQSNDIRLSASEEKLIELATGLSYGRPFSEREWTPRNKGFSTEEFRTLKDEMIKFGLIEMKVEGVPRQGYVLTEDGQEWFKRYASPSPTDDAD
jgi:hypothetical protein